MPSTLIANASDLGDLDFESRVFRTSPRVGVVLRGPRFWVALVSLSCRRTKGLLLLLPGFPRKSHLEESGPQITPKYGAISFATQRIDCWCHRVAAAAVAAAFNSLRFDLFISCRWKLKLHSPRDCEAGRLGFCLSFISIRCDSLRFVLQVIIVNN